MTGQPHRSIRLFGTDEPVAPPRLLTTGPLGAELEAGNLRYIRFGGVEVMRAVSFIVRDRDWGTYAPEISDLVIDEAPERFTVTYAARAGDDAQSFTYRARIEGDANGTLRFAAEGAAETDFETNRTGFVVLHAVELAGTPVTITHTDGEVVEGVFPERIDPMQPMMDLRALAHRTPKGLEVTCLMEGDTFEMEDQRNWTDASYKTYVRPLALPWPYTLKAGEAVAQSVTLSVAGAAPARAGEDAVRVVVGAPAGTVPTGTVPALGMGLDPEDAETALAQREVLAGIGVSHLICHLDPRRGHGRDTLARQAEIAEAMGAIPWLEAMIAEVDGFEREVAALGDVVATLGIDFETVLVSPAADLKSTVPGGRWPEAPPAEALYEAARKAFPGARIGGGMFSYFTELNRKRPPADGLDLVSFTTSPLVHAGDDRSVMETLHALPAVLASVKAIAGGKPFAIGPSAIGMRGNPYGEAPKDNPQNIRQAMNRNDPRQRGLLGAAWNLGYFAHFASGGAQAVALGSPTGAFGAVAAADGLPKPWYDVHGGVYPVYHVLRGLARLRGARLVALEASAPGRIIALAAESGDGLEIWLANPDAEPVTVALDAGIVAGATLDAETFVAAAATPDFMDRLSTVPAGPLRLDAHAVVRLVTNHTN